MKIPHEVVERVKSHEGSLSQKQGAPSMHSAKLLEDDCPKCHVLRTAVFWRQGISKDGKIVGWYEFKCFECRICWIAVVAMGIVEKFY